MPGGNNIMLSHSLSAWWRHQIKAFSALLAICAGNSPHTGQWRGASIFSLVCVWINGWVNNREAGDLRRYRAQFDVSVMWVLGLKQYGLPESQSTMRSSAPYVLILWTDERKKQYIESLQSTTVTSWWARWRLKSPASRWLAQPFVQAQFNENTKVRVTGPCEGNLPVTSEFPSQRASNAEHVFIWWRHHGRRIERRWACYIGPLRQSLDIGRLTQWPSLPMSSSVWLAFHVDHQY